MREFLVTLLTNKRFLAAFFGITSMLLAPLVAALSVKLGLDQADSKALLDNANQLIAYIVITYVGGQSLSDTWGKGNPANAVPAPKPEFQELGEIKAPPVDPPK